MKRYVLAVLSLTAALCAAAGVLNRMVDPFGGWGHGDAQGFDLAYARLYQAHAANAALPAAIVLGTSRAQTGLDAEHPALRPGRGFVAAASNQPVSESAAILEKLASRGVLRRVVWGLDDLAFSCVLPAPLFESSRWDASDRLRMLISVVTVEASLKRLLAATDVAPARRFRADGGVEVTDTLIAGRGHHAVTVRSESTYYDAYRRFALVHCTDPTRDAPLARFQQALSVAHAHGIDLRLLISPAHARQWEVLHASGAWVAWERWKRDLVRINEEEANRSARAPFPLWDFSGYNRYTTEAFPEAGNTQARMQWYWESSHYKKELGDLVLDRMFGYTHPESGLDPSFGVRLHSANVEYHLARIREERAQWLSQFAREAAEIQATAQRKAHPHSRTTEPLAGV